MVTRCISDNDMTFKESAVPEKVFISGNILLVLGHQQEKFFILLCQLLIFNYYGGRNYPVSLKSFRGPSDWYLASANTGYNGKETVVNAIKYMKLEEAENNEGINSSLEHVTTDEAQIHAAVIFFDAKLGEFWEEISSAASNYHLSLIVSRELDHFLIRVFLKGVEIPPIDPQRVVQTALSISQQLQMHLNVELSSISCLSSMDRDSIQSWAENELTKSCICVHELIETQAQVCPSANAIITTQETLSYQQLDFSASTMAQSLHEMGIRSGSSVPIIANKSPLAVVGILAILKAGATCAVLNPLYPEKYLKDQISRLGAGKCLSSLPYAEKTRRCTASPVIILEEMKEYKTASRSKLHQASKPHDAAFVIFTSGTSGKPKGVTLSHMSISTMALSTAKNLGIGSNSRVVQYAAFGWAVNLIDTFSTLAAGGCLCIPSEFQQQNEIISTMVKLQATQITLPPSLACRLSLTGVPSLQTLILAGESIPQGFVAQWDGSASLFMNYGCSETMMTVASKILPQSVPHGRPVSTVRCWLVDPQNHDCLAPIGAIGELIVESVQVANGYLDDKVETAKQFIQSPPSWWHEFGFQSDPEIRFFKSGDLFRYSKTGELFIIGRKDAQMKIRGQRLEPGEIEHHLRRLLPIAYELAVTVGKPQHSRNNQIVVFIAFSKEYQKQSSTMERIAEKRKLMQNLKESLGKVLPAYMIPSGYVELNSLPRTISGKLNRRELLSLISEYSYSEIESFNNADTDCNGEKHGESNETKETMVSLHEAQRKLRTAWNDILDVSNIRMEHNSNFFALGADSIDAIELVQHLRKEGYSLTVKSVFKHPTLAKMAEALVDVSKMNKEKPLAPFSLLSEQELHTIISEATSRYGIIRATIENAYPCTPIQEGLITGTAVRSGAYVANHEFLLPAGWEVSKFEQVWNQIISRTPILRSRIIQVANGNCFQIVISDDGYIINLDKQDHQDFDQSMELGFGTRLFYSTLTKNNNDGRVIWNWTIHHALYDGWTTEIMLDLVYKAYKHAEEIPFTDFSKFVKHLSTLDRGDAAAYWISELKGYRDNIFPHLKNKTVQPRPETFARRSIPRKQSSACITMSTIIRGAWALVLSCHSDTSDVVYGVTTTGRTTPFPGVGDLIGPLICTIPFRVRIDLEMPALAYLSGLQARSTELINHEHYGLQNIQTLGNDGPFQACKFQNLLIVQPERRSQRNGQPQRIQEISNDNSTYLSYALTVEVTMNSNELNIEAIYDESIISKKSVDRVLNQFCHVIYQLQENQTLDYKLRDINIISPEDISEIKSWNSMPISEHNVCLHELIEQRSKAWLDSIAICSWDGQLSYHELFELSTKLSYDLIKGGVKSATYIPICLEKSFLTVVSILAVMKSGAAFVLIDSSIPPLRIKKMLNIVQAKLVITSSMHAPLFNGHGTAVMIVDEFMGNVDQEDRTEQLTNEVTVYDPAYVCFTSGSTGEPKGVILEHRHTSSGFLAQIDAGLFKPGWRVLQFASYSFDPSIADMIGPLLVGGCICIPQEQQRLLNLSKIINQFHVDMVELTPSIANTLEPESVPHLKTLRLGGEAMSHSQIKRWSSHCHLENSYGPSECCVTCTVTDRVTFSSNPSNIGKAFGCLIWIVDLEDREKLAPLGSIGELAIQGPIVGRGYINNYSQTLTSFLPRAPWLEKLGLNPEYPTYMTGDIVRYDDEGCVIFLGRKDNQVKLRGQRIEIGEVEKNIIKDEHVSLCIVSCPKTGAYANELVAVLELHHLKTDVSHICKEDCFEILKNSDPELQCIMKHLQDFLNQNLPGFMIPTNWLTIKKMPLLNSGKCDRKKINQWLNDLDLKIFNHESPQPAIQISKDDTIGIQVRQQIQCLAGPIVNQNPVSSLEYDIDINATGLNSISMIVLLRWINEQFKIKMTVPDFLACNSAIAIARRIEICQSSSTIRTSTSSKDDKKCKIQGSYEEVEELLRDLQTMEQNVHQSHSLDIHESSKSIQTVLVTGATGYLGTQIIRYLLNDPNDYRVIVLVRSSSIERGKNRIISAALLADWWREDYLDRLEIWIGDLEKAQFGLSTNEWNRLSGKSANWNNVDAIVHNGAIVNWFASYTKLKPVNVLSTLQFLLLAKTSPELKALVYISGGPQWDPVNDDDSDMALSKALTNTNGYGKSKLISEHLIVRSKRRSNILRRRVSVISPGLVIGTEYEGVANEDDFLWRIVAGSVSIGKYPREPKDLWVFISSANIFSETVINNLRSNTEPHPMRSKLFYGLFVHEFWAAANSVLPRKLKEVSYDEWLANLKTDVNKKEANHPCWPIMHIITDSSKVIGTLRMENIKKDIDQFRARIFKSIEKNVEYLLYAGFFAPASLKVEGSLFRRSPI